MEAAVLPAPNTPLVVESVTLDPPKTGEVLVRLAASGVCHSDLHVLHGNQRVPFPIVLGHEGAGWVEAVGPGVESVSVGDHVVLSWVPSCGTCYFCRHGQPNLCSTAVPAMLSGGLIDQTSRLRRRDGSPLHHYSFLSTFAEYAVVPEASCIPIRKDAPLDKAALIGCAVMTGVGAVINTAKVTPGSSVLVVGAGGVGLNILQGARLAGAHPIIAVDTRETKLAKARLFGASHTARPEEATELIRTLSEGRGVDYAFEAVGQPSTMRFAWESTRRGGTVVLVGIPPDEATLTLPAIRLPREEKRITGSLYGSARPHVDMPLLLDLYMAGKLLLDELVSGHFALTAINEAVHHLEQGEATRPVVIYAESRSS